MIRPMMLGVGGRVEVGVCVGDGVWVGVRVGDGVWVGVGVGVAGRHWTVSARRLRTLVHGSALKLNSR